MLYGSGAVEAKDIGHREHLPGRSALQLFFVLSLL